MKARHKTYLKLNIMSLVFIVVSFMSVTLAWFAYSGLADVTTEVGVKAWYIELYKDDEPVTNDISISINDIYPGMTPVYEKVKIKNMGDSIAQISYNITSARLLDIDNYVIDETITSPFVEDELSHDYPFHINIHLNKGYALDAGDEAEFEVAISWPLDSDTDELDSYWGVEAYNFQESENDKLLIDPNYQVRPSIQVVINLEAEQYMEEETTSDTRYDLGDTILYDVVNNTSCIEVSSTCLSTKIIDVDNKLGDDTVSLLPDVTSTYLESTYSNYNQTLTNYTSTWTVTNRALQISDLMSVISTDINNSVLVRNTLSDSIIGSLSYSGRMTTELTKAINYSGYYRFNNEIFSYLVKDTCYWTSSEYDINNAFAFYKIDVNYSKLYPNDKTATCSIIPVIIALKSHI